MQASDSRPQDCSKESLNERIRGLITFNNLENLTLPEHLGLESFHTYILTDGFYTNCYISTLEDDSTKFVVNCVYGEPLVADREYMIIDPLY